MQNGQRNLSGTHFPLSLLYGHHLPNLSVISANLNACHPHFWILLSRILTNQNGCPLVLHSFNTNSFNESKWPPASNWPDGFVENAQFHSLSQLCFSWQTSGIPTTEWGWRWPSPWCVRGACVHAIMDYVCCVHQILSKYYSLLSLMVRP